MKDNPKAIGEQSEAMILARFLSKGEIVSIPFGNNQRYDLLLDRNGSFVRVQCKTGRIRKNTVKFNCCSTSGGKSKKNYKGQADLFAVYCPDNNSVYLVPVLDAPSVTCMLRINTPKNKGKQKTIRYAEDYLF